MITPTYTQVQGPAFSSEIQGKWYCVYYEFRIISVARYLHPTGWKRYAHYFDTKEAAEAAFSQYGATPWPITDEELRQENVFREQCERNSQDEDNKSWGNMLDRNIELY